MKTTNKLRLQKAKNTMIILTITSFNQSQFKPLGVYGKSTAAS